MAPRTARRHKEGAEFGAMFGVDFSGAKRAGENLWVAEGRVRRDGRVEVIGLESAAAACGTAERAAALGWLVGRIAQSRGALWGMDFPFALPIEVMAARCRLAGQVRWVSQWRQGAYALGLECMRRSQALNGKRHLRRLTDTLARTPFDCYHYRIIYQTFFGMRDVLGPLARVRGTCIYPFQYGRLAEAVAGGRVVVEACPASTLKRLGLPHQNYKQPEGGPLMAKRRRVRRAILAGIEAYADVPAGLRRKIMRNPGGDALDAVLAAVGAWRQWRALAAAGELEKVARHTRFGREGYTFA